MTQTVAYTLFQTLPNAHRTPPHGGGESYQPNVKLWAKTNQKTGIAEGDTRCIY